MDRCGVHVDAHLLIFNRDPVTSWEEKVFRREETIDEKTIHVWGM